MLRLAEAKNPKADSLELKRLNELIIKDKLLLESIDSGFTARATNIFFISGDCKKFTSI